MLCGRDPVAEHLADVVEQPLAQAARVVVARRQRDHGQRGGGQQIAAGWFRALLAGGTADARSIQDALCFRVLAPVFGVVLTAFGTNLVAGYRQLESDLKPLATARLQNFGRHIKLGGPKRSMRSSIKRNSAHRR